MSNAAIDRAMIHRWIAARKDQNAIQAELQQQGVDTADINAYLQEFKKLRIDKRQVQGFIWMGTGAFLGFLACFITLLEVLPALHGVILYGLTSVAVVLIFIGFYLVFED